MNPPRYLVKEAIEYVRDIENNVPKHFWPGLIRKGWMILEEDGTPNWNYAVTAHVTNEDLVWFVSKCQADIYFYTVRLNQPLAPNLKIEDSSYE